MDENDDDDDDDDDDDMLWDSLRTHSMDQTYKIIRNNHW